MATYIEPVSNDDGGRFSRLRADSVEELIAFAERAGIRGSIHTHPTVAALTWLRCDRRDRRRAIRAGAEEVSWHDAFGRIARLTVDGTRPPASPDFTRFGMVRRSQPVVAERSVRSTIVDRRPGRRTVATDRVVRRTAEIEPVLVVDLSPC